jgi:hypothetical protein
MKGTPTVGKAKSIKEKRELAAELGELTPTLSTKSADDVKEFEANRGVSSTGRSRRSARRDNYTPESDGGEAEEPAKASTMAAVMDFLDDQDDDSDSD